MKMIFFFARMGMLLVVALLACACSDDLVEQLPNEQEDEVLLTFTAGYGYSGSQTKVSYTPSGNDVSGYSMTPTWDGDEQILVFGRSASPKHATFNSVSNTLTDDKSRLSFAGVIGQGTAYYAYYPVKTVEEGNSAGTDYVRVTYNVTSQSQDCANPTANLKNYIPFQAQISGTSASFTTDAVVLRFNLTLPSSAESVMKVQLDHTKASFVTQYTYALYSEEKPNNTLSVKSESVCVNLQNDVADAQVVAYLVLFKNVDAVLDVVLTATTASKTYKTTINLPALVSSTCYTVNATVSEHTAGGTDGYEVEDGKWD